MFDNQIIITIFVNKSMCEGAQCKPMNVKLNQSVMLKLSELGADKVPKFEGYYCTKRGDVYSVRKGYIDEIGHSLDKDGYLKVMLVDNDGHPKHFRKHRVIAMTYLGESNLYINHINGNKQDNRVENLEYVTNRENQSHWRLSRNYDIGVCWAKKEKKWRAYFQENRKWEHLGFYSNKNEAKQAYLNRLAKSNITNKYGTKISKDIQTPF